MHRDPSGPEPQQPGCPVAAGPAADPCATSLCDRLAELEQRYRLLVEHVIDVLFMLRLEEPLVLPAPGEALPPVDPQRLMRSWRFAFITPSIQRMFGYTVDEALGLSLEELLAPESLQVVRRLVREDLPVALAQGPSGFPRRVVELQCVRKDGARFWAEITAKFATDEEGRLTGVVGVVRDVTQRKQAELARQEQEQRFQLLLENLPDFLVLLDAAGRIRYMNRQPKTAPAEELLGTDGSHVIAPQFRAAARECVRRALQSGEVQKIEHEDVLGRHFRCRLVPVGDDPATRQVVVIATDVSEQYRFQESLLREQQLLRRLLDLQEQERQLIACEIHDGVAQQLTAARFQFEAFQQLQTRNPPAAEAAFAKGLELLGQGLAEARRLISGSRPPILDEQGLVPAVEHLICEWRERGGPQIEFVHAAPDERLPGLLETTIFRIVQEALANACRHSRSPRVFVQLVCDEQSIRLSVRDWGVGFDAREVSPSRFGLQGIRERARLLGGQAEVDAAPGKGTTISVELPLAGPQDAPLR